MEKHHALVSFNINNDEVLLEVRGVLPLNIQEEEWDTLTLEQLLKGTGIADLNQFIISNECNLTVDRCNLAGIIQGILERLNPLEFAPKHLRSETNGWYYDEEATELARRLKGCRKREMHLEEIRIAFEFYFGIVLKEKECLALLNEIKQTYEKFNQFFKEKERVKISDESTM